MFKKTIAAVSFGLAVALSGPVAAAGDPSMHEIYEAANSGRLAQAQEMIGTVLKDHPDSAKAHYVAAELDAKQGLYTGAREQLATAERLAPGLPFAKADAVAALKAEIGGSGARPAERSGGFVAAPARRSGGLSPGFLIVVVGVIGLVVWLIARRRSGPAAYPAAGGNYGPSGYGPVGPGGYGSAPPQAGGGIGSGIAGGLASGLAVGAGVVAGEAIAHRLMGDGERSHERYVDDNVGRGDSRGNADMGGNDFGVSDSGSWDDSSASSDSGSDDWS